MAWIIHLAIHHPLELRHLVYGNWLWNLIQIHLLIHKITSTSFSLFLPNLRWIIWLNILLRIHILCSIFIPQLMLSVSIRTIFTIMASACSLKMPTNHSFIIWSIRICSYNLLTRYKAIILHWLWQKRIYIIIAQRGIHRERVRKNFLNIYRIIFNIIRLVWILKTITIVLEHQGRTTPSESSTSCSSLYLLIISLVICIRIICLHIIVSSDI